MSQTVKEPLLEEILRLLKRHFGKASIEQALANVLGITTVTAIPENQSPRTKKSYHYVGPNITAALEQLRAKDPQKYSLLNNFYKDLKLRRLLPESQDIRQFAQLVGLKEIHGKSRKDLVPKLVRFLLDQPAQKLQAHIAAASKISEHERQQGFSVLTDKLLGDK